jgi:hypothetical protein
MAEEVGGHGGTMGSVAVTRKSFWVLGDAVGEGRPWRLQRGGCPDALQTQSSPGPAPARWFVARPSVRRNRWSVRLLVPIDHLLDE